jgi:hypothetical protein
MDPRSSTDLNITGGSLPNDDGQWSRHVETGDADDCAIRAPSPLPEIPLPTRVASTSGFDDDDDDEDNWSRKVETDDLQRLPSSVVGEVATAAEEGDDDDSAVHLHGRDTVDGIGAGAPQREEPTLKEKLVERERQRRVESERGRWKRQFAMAAHAEAVDEGNHMRAVEGNLTPWTYDEEDGIAIRETNSVAGTVGEDTVAPIETLEDEDPNQLNYPMERFLQQQVNAMEENIDSNKRKESSREGNQNQGVVMERFLQETPVLGVDDGITNGEMAASSSNVHRSVSFETDQPVSNARILSEEDAYVQASGAVGPGPSLPHDFLNMSTASSSFADASNDQLVIGKDHLELPDDQDALPFGLVTSATASIANVSTICLPPAEDDQDTNRLHLDIQSANESHLHSDVQLSGQQEAEAGILSPDPQGRVVLRLTEAEIEEMEAIDEASRSNAPPSERDDMSELGELVSDFGAAAHLDTNLSQGTPTTAMESASSVANQGSVVIMNMSSSYHPEDQHSADAMGTGSVSSHVVASSAGGDASVAANPPSHSGRDDEARRSPLLNEIFPILSTAAGTRQPTTEDLSLPVLSETPSSEKGLDTAPAVVVMRGDTEFGLQVPTDETIVNRMVRPGMTYSYKLPNSDAMKNLQYAPSSPLKKASSFPDHIVSTSSRTEHIDDFDFDKYEPPRSPPANDGSNDFLSGNELWSSGMSPLRSMPMDGNSDPSLLPSLPNYGTTLRDRTDPDVETQRWGSGGRNGDKDKVEDDEYDPLITGGIPREVPARDHRRASSYTSLASIRTMDDVNSIAESVFSDIRSESTATKNLISSEAHDYFESSTLKRAFPERLFALGVTLIFEIPVLLMV